MRLTHHHAPIRSLILIIVVVLATVWTAFMLIKFQQNYFATKPAANSQKITQSRLNTDEWQNYIDRNYPLNILVPKDWKINQNEDYSGFYTVNLETPNRGTLKIFISQTGYAGFNANTGTAYKTNQGIEVTKQDDWIYSTKVGDYYYTFDATLGLNLEKELSEIVRLAKFN